MPNTSVRSVALLSFLEPAHHSNTFGFSFGTIMDSGLTGKKQVAQHIEYCFRQLRGNTVYSRYDDQIIAWGKFRYSQWFILEEIGQKMDCEVRTAGRWDVLCTTAFASKAAWWYSSLGCHTLFTKLKGVVFRQPVVLREDEERLSKQRSFTRACSGHSSLWSSSYHTVNPSELFRRRHTIVIRAVFHDYNH